MRNITVDSFVFLVMIGLIGCQSITTETPTAITSRSTDLVSHTATKSVLQPIFQSILPELQRKTKIPIMLPGYVPESDNPLLVGLIEKSNAFEYRVMLALSETCNGGTACYLGRVNGVLLPQGSYIPEGTEVTLVNNITAYFVDATCGASCSDSTLTWSDRNVYYQVAIKAGKLETLLEMANSMTKIY